MCFSVKLVSTTTYRSGTRGSRRLMVIIIMILLIAVHRAFVTVHSNDRVAVNPAIDRIRKMLL